MRVPDTFFPVLNRIMKLLLRSPLHGVMSGSVMTIYFIGRRSAHARSTPVRYLRESDDRVFCLTSRQTAWWHNFPSPTPVQLQLAGRRVAATAHATPNDPVRIEAALRQMLDRFPGDAAYHGLTKTPSAVEFDAAVGNDVLVTFVLQGG